MGTKNRKTKTLQNSKWRKLCCTKKGHDRSGVWADIAFEQTLMKCTTKSSFSIIQSEDITESKRAVWILSHLKCSEETMHTISLLSNVSYIGSEQHTNLTDAKIPKNFKDINN